MIWGYLRAVFSVTLLASSAPPLTTNKSAQISTNILNFQHRFALIPEIVPATRERTNSTYRLFYKCNMAKSLFNFFKGFRRKSAFRARRVANGSLEGATLKRGIKNESANTPQLRKYSVSIPIALVDLINASARKSYNVNKYITTIVASTINRVYL